MYKIAAICMSFFVAPLWAAELEVIDPYIYSANPNAKSGGAFMILRNIGDEPLEILGASAKIAKRVEIHTHIMDAGAMKMTEIEGGIRLAAGECALLARGGLHIMLMGLNSTLENGATHELNLQLSSGEEQSFSAKVDRGRAETAIDAQEDLAQCFDAKQYAEKAASANGHDGH